MKTKKTRQRQPQPETSYNGMTLAQWRLSAQHVEWAQTQQGFRDLLAVVVNARSWQICPATDAVQAARALGQREGIEHAIEVLRLLAVPEAKPPLEAEPTYPKPEETQEPLD